MTRRSIIKMIILTIVTLGLYELYWSYNFQSQLKEKTGKGFSGWVHILMIFCTFGIYNIYWQYAAGKRLFELNVKNDYAAMYLILSLVGLNLLNMFLLQNQANEVAEQ